MTQTDNDSNEASTPEVGATLTLTPTRMAHGGEAIANAEDGRVVFIRGAYPGDTVAAEVTKVKKRFAHATTTQVTTAGEFRGTQACPVAAQGGGCCDFGDINPERELELKAHVLAGQLSRVKELSGLPEVELIDLEPARGWRTRVRLGVDESGRAGTRMLRSNELITDAACTQVVDGLLDGIVGTDARKFTPGAEVLVTLDSTGTRHVVESRKAPRGGRVERSTNVIEGGGTVTEEVDNTTFHFPPTAFWQAHSQAPATYTRLVREWLADVPSAAAETPIAWDLYGGVGLFVPALSAALGANGKIYSVDYSTSANQNEQSELAKYNVVSVNKRVENALEGLPAPHIIVSDPPRTGAGDAVIEQAAAAGPTRVIQVGCDPATFSRDLAAWAKAGYNVERMALINGFPGTHHFEAIAQLGR